MQAEAHEARVRVRPDPGNPCQAECDERKVTHLPFWCWCEQCVAGETPNLPHKRRSSDRDVSETEMDFFCMDHKTDRELMTVLKNFLDCESGCAFACAVDTGPGDFPVSVVCKDLECCGSKRAVLRARYLCFKHGVVSGTKGGNHS